VLCWCVCGVVDNVFSEVVVVIFDAYSRSFQNHVQVQIRYYRSTAMFWDRYCHRNH
jgi:hypothetical protein